MKKKNDDFTESFLLTTLFIAYKKNYSFYFDKIHTCHQWNHIAYLSI